MELSDLLAREGYDPHDLSALMSWARTRAESLLRGLDPDAPVSALLAGFSRHVATDSSMRTRAGEEDAPADLRRAVTAATAASPEPAPVDDDPDSGLGGFARFGAILRMNRPYPYRHQEPAVDERPTLARSFALAAERASADEPPPPPPPAAPPSPPPSGDFSNTLPLAAIGFSAEESGGLVLGIPDEDSGLSDLFDPNAGPDLVEAPPPPPVTPRPRPTSAPARRASTLVDDDDEDVFRPPAAPPPTTLATPVDVDDTLAEPLRTRDTPPSPGLPAVAEPGADPSAPVLRHRGPPKKKVVELGAPLAKPRAGGTGKVTVNPRSASSKHPRKPPPPPPPRKSAPVEEEIEELSRVELIDDLPAYLRDDDE